MKRSLAAVVLVIAVTLLALAQGPKEIEAQIMKLRSLPDDERARVTRQLATQIAALPAGNEKVLLATSLSNLSTEGYFGEGTLQLVTDTLARAVKETPQGLENGQPAFACQQLAALATIEGMKVDLDDPVYKLALRQLAETQSVRSAATFELQDLDGKTWRLSDLKGKVVIVNFWATWCPPCRKEMPDLQTLYNRFKSRGLVVLAISDEKRDVVEKFVKEKGYTFPILLDPGRKVNDAYRMGGIPNSYLYNREGKLAAQSMDMRTMEQFLRLLAKAGLN